MFDPGPCVYMEKMAGGSDIADLLSLDRPLGETLGLIAERRGSDIRDIMAVVLDRPRHEEGIAAIREAGARVRLITDGDVSAALLSVSDRSPVSLLWGIGGTPEGVISAAAIKAFGGSLIGRLWPRDEAERQTAVDAGYDLSRVLDQDDLVRGDDCFFSATGVTDRDHRVDRHALAHRDRAAHQRAPQPAEAAALHGRAVRLSRPNRRPGRPGARGATGPSGRARRRC
jgi:fructose-1,6-bisphosphatase II